MHVASSAFIVEQSLKKVKILDFSEFKFGRKTLLLLYKRHKQRGAMNNCGLHCISNVNCASQAVMSRSVWVGRLFR